ncbi:DoxX family protein [Pseudomonas sp. WCS374]|uniref:DoxX family protein n=1 Tax=Pseudomonas sp. WCS374 TaxID=1495331 RepID=UPI00049AB8F3|nr:DoxX family protein [Pseudomonas sp. WCS374]AIB42867.1 LysR family transcriptional regulator [Pseudomonas sp. WCS374]
MMYSSFNDRMQDFGLLFLRISGAVFLLCVHGLPKLLDFSAQLKLIEDPFHMGATLTLCMAIFAEVLCPLLIIAGVLTRLACLPILFLLLVAMVVIHPEWTIDQAQFGWLLTIIFTSLLIAGPGRLALNGLLAGALRYA